MRNRLLLALLAVASVFVCAGFRPAPSRDHARPLVLRDVTIVDVVTGRLVPHSTVTVRGSRIVSVGPANRVAVPRGARVIDGRGRFVIPGLWDMHTHVLWDAAAMPSFLSLNVTQGVTGIRDMGGNLAVLAALHDSLAHADPLWPRVVAAGAVLDGPEPAQPDIAIAVADSASAKAAVDSLARAGADFVKVYTLLPRDAYFSAIAEARRLGLPVAGHLPLAITPEEAAHAGQRSIEHLRDETDLLCAPRDVDACARLAKVFVAEHTWQVPTLVVLRFKAQFEDSSFARDPRLTYMPASLRAEWLREREGKLRRGASYAASKREHYADERSLTGSFAKAGVPLLAGTDACTAFSYPGFSLHDELALLVDNGLSPLAALRAATLEPATYFAARDSMGSIAPGHVADLVLLRRNPLADIRATREIDSVVLRGRVLARRDLDAMLERVAASQRR